MNTWPAIAAERVVRGKAVVSVMLFWGVGFAALGWLVFKIAELT
jgi:hypothetical protein